MVPNSNKIATEFASRIAGKTILITGPSIDSLGSQTAIYLAAEQPRLLLLAGRDKSKIRPVIDQISGSHPDVEVIHIELDLSSQVSVRKAVSEISAKVRNIDILINNAGVMGIEQYSTTSEGIEMHFGVNHIGHFLLTMLLFPKLSQGARVVNVSSSGYLTGGIREDYNFEQGPYNCWLAYAQSKTANILFSSALARHFKNRGLEAFAVNPGYVPDTKLQTNITQDSFAEGYALALKAMDGAPMPNMTIKTLAEGASNILIAALDPNLNEHNGAFLTEGLPVPIKELEPHAVGEDRENKLWALSEKLIGEKFEYGY